MLSKKVSFLYKFIWIPYDEKLLLLEATFLLFISKLFLMLPFKFCIKCLHPADQMTGIANPALLIKIRIAVYRANKLAFWKNVCLVKSLAVRLMMERRHIGSVLYLGLQFKDGKKLIAHAWLISGKIFMTPKGKGNYKEIYRI